MKKENMILNIVKLKIMPVQNQIIAISRDFLHKMLFSLLGILGDLRNTWIKDPDKYTIINPVMNGRNVPSSNPLMSIGRSCHHF
jgi:hypothetical protein